MRACSTLLILAMATSPLFAASAFVPPSSVPETGIGFRGDGTGVFPNSNPPVKWSATENVKWKVETANWGYGCPVPVGNRVLQLTEPGWKSIWPQLTCYDADTGEQVWQVEVVAPQADDEDKKMLLALREKTKAAYRIMGPLDTPKSIGSNDPIWKSINAELGKFDLQCNSYKKGYGLLRYVKETSDKYKTMRSALYEKGIKAEPTWANFGHAQIGHTFPTPVSDGKHIFVITRHWTVACFDIATGAVKWSVNAFEKGTTKMGRGLLASPRIYAGTLLTPFGATDGDNSLFAWDMETGKQLWRVSSRAKSPLPNYLKGNSKNGKYLSRAGGSPVIMTIGDTPVIVCGGGAVVRLSDGKRFDIGVPQATGSYIVDDAGDRIYGAGCHDRKSTIWGFHLAINGDALSVSEVFAYPGGGASSGVFIDNLVIMGSKRLDPVTGQPCDFDERADDKMKANLAAACKEGDQGKVGFFMSGFYKTKHRSGPMTHHITLSAGGRLYGLKARGPGKNDPGGAHYGLATVTTVDGKKLAENRLPAGDWQANKQKWQEQGFKPMWSYANQFTIGGDRIYLVSNDHLWCIGE